MSIQIVVNGEDRAVPEGQTILGLLHDLRIDPARVAVTLAHAHKIRQAILSGEIQNQADAARKLGLTRARLSQILEMTNLAPDLQEEILFLEAIDGREPLSGRALRGVLRVTAWDEQRLDSRLHRSSTQPALPGAPPRPC